MELVNNTISELKENNSKEADTIRKAISKQTPDDILLILQKSGDLSQYFEYWQQRSYQDTREIKATFQGNDRPVIQVIIDQHILKLIGGEPSKIIWRDPNIVNPHGSLSVHKKKPDYYTQSKLALVLNISRQAVQKLCKGKFQPAIKDKKINLWHPIVQQHKSELEAKRLAVKSPMPKPKAENQPRKTKPSAGAQTTNVNFNIEITFEEIENLTIKQVVEKYGGIIGFKSYVDALDKMAAWKIKEQKYKERSRELIEKKPVALSLFSIINMAFKRILEYPETVTDQLIAIAQGNKKTSRIDAIDLQTQTLSKILKSVKREVVRDLKKIEE